MKKKLKDSGGLTMVEMLCAVMILVLLCLLTSTGINMAVKSYRDITAESETELLLSTLSGALTDKLRYCVVTQTPDVAGGTAYAYSIGEIAVDAGRIVVQKKDSDGTVVSQALLPAGAYGISHGYIGEYEVEDLKITPSISGTAAIFEISLKIKEKSGSIGAEATFHVRCLSPVKDAGAP